MIGSLNHIKKRFRFQSIFGYYTKMKSIHFFTTVKRMLTYWFMKDVKMFITQIKKKGGRGERERVKLWLSASVTFFVHLQLSDLIVQLPWPEHLESPVSAAYIHHQTITKYKKLPNRKSTTLLPTDLVFCYFLNQAYPFKNIGNIIDSPLFDLYNNRK